MILDFERERTRINFKRSLNFTTSKSNTGFKFYFIKTSLERKEKIK